MSIIQSEKTTGPIQLKFCTTLVTHRPNAIFIFVSILVASVYMTVWQPFLLSLSCSIIRYKFTMEIKFGLLKISTKQNIISGFSGLTVLYIIYNFTSSLYFSSTIGRVILKNKYAQWFKTVNELNNLWTVSSWLKKEVLQTVTAFNTSLNSLSVEQLFWTCSTNFWNLRKTYYYEHSNFRWYNFRYHTFDHFKNNFNYYCI